MLLCSLPGAEGPGGAQPEPRDQRELPTAYGMSTDRSGWGGKRWRVTHRGQSQTSTVVKMEERKKKKKREHNVITGGKVSKVMEKCGMNDGRKRERLAEGNGEEGQISPD